MAAGLDGRVAMPAPFCIPQQLFEQMQAHIEACLPEEGCGLLGGRGRQAEVCIPVTNEARSRTRFRMQPLEQLRAMKAIESQGLEVNAIFHSHPDGPDSPSATDLAEFAYPGTVSLIWFRDRLGWRVKGFWITAGQAVPVEVIIQRNLAGQAGL